MGGAKRLGRGGRWAEPGGAVRPLRRGLEGLSALGLEGRGAVSSPGGQGEPTVLRLLEAPRRRRLGQPVFFVLF